MHTSCFLNDGIGIKSQDKAQKKVRPQEAAEQKQDRARIRIRKPPCRASENPVDRCSLPGLVHRYIDSDGSATEPQVTQTGNTYGQVQGAYAAGHTRTLVSVPRGDSQVQTKLLIAVILATMFMIVEVIGGYLAQR